MNSANKSINLVLIFLITLVLSACEETEQAEENTKKKDEQTAENISLENEPSNGDPNMENNLQDITYNFTNPNTGQEFAILHAYKLYDDYFKALEEYPDESPHQLYQQVISEPIYDACFKDVNYKFSVFDWVPKESNFNSMKKQIESLDKEHLNKLLEDSLVKSSDILSSNNLTTVCLFPENEKFTFDMYTIGTGKITVFLSELNNYFKLSELDNYNKAGISHEYHHSVWFEKHVTEDYFMTVLDNMIMEGSAIMFETLVYPDTNSKDWVLDKSFDKEYWSIIETYLESGATNDFISGGSKGLPDYYGYSEGYKMIRSYLELHPNAMVEEWTSKSPKEIFEESNYISNYE